MGKIFHEICSRTNFLNTGHQLNVRLVSVIQPGLEPGTYGLEGRCSNPTELLDRCSFSRSKDTKLYLSTNIVFSEILTKILFLYFHTIA
jgi:hypothetical protein